MVEGRGTEGEGHQEKGEAGGKVGGGWGTWLRRVRQLECHQQLGSGQQKKGGGRVQMNCKMKGPMMSSDSQKVVLTSAERIGVEFETLFNLIIIRTSARAASCRAAPM